MRVLAVSELGVWSEQWDRLATDQPLASPFLRSWWVPAAATGAPAVVVCHEDDCLVGGAAFQTDRVGRGPIGLERVRSLGQGVLGPDHLDVIARPGREDEVVERVLGWLRRPGNRILDLDGLAAGGRLGRALSGHEIDRVGAPWAPLPADIDTYLADRPGRLRSTVARSRRRLEKAGGTIRQVTPEQVEPAMDALARLHDQRWADESAFLGAWTSFRRAAVAGVQQGAVVMHEAVDGDGAVVATELDLLAGGRVAFYQSGRSTEREWRGVGSVVKAAVIEQAIGTEADEYDLLRGDESYKGDWATERREVVRVRLGVGPVGRAVTAGANTWKATGRPTLERLRDRWSRITSRGAS